MLPPSVKRAAVQVFGERVLAPLEREWRRLRRSPRYQQTTTFVLGPDLIVPDCASFIAMHAEIFKNQIYRFRTESANPYIIDCGANIGVSAIYFNRNYPTSSIIAFEADPGIFDILTKNLQSFEASNVQAVNCAIWDEDTTLSFAIEGADAGHAARGAETEGGPASVTPVEAVRLAPYLTHRPVDMLKMDIEGAEMRVLRDCAPYLNNVNCLFVEYHSYPGEEQCLPELSLLLREAGFRLYVQSVHGVIPCTPLFDPPRGNASDLQLNIFAYRDTTGSRP